MRWSESRSECLPRTWLQLRKCGLEQPASLENRKCHAKGPSSLQVMTKQVGRASLTALSAGPMLLLGHSLDKSPLLLQGFLRARTGNFLQEVGTAEAQSITASAQNFFFATKRVFFGDKASQVAISLRNLEPKVWERCPGGFKVVLALLCQMLHFGGSRKQPNFGSISSSL